MYVVALLLVALETNDSEQYTSNYWREEKLFIHSATSVVSTSVCP